MHILTAIIVGGLCGGLLGAVIGYIVVCILVVREEDVFYAMCAGFVGTQRGVVYGLLVGAAIGLLWSYL